MLNLSKLNIGTMERFERIAEAINECGLSRAELAEKLGVTNATLTQWSKGDTKNLKLENLYNLADATGYSARWLAIGEGPKFGSDAPLGVRENSAPYGNIKNPALRKIVDRLISIHKNGGISRQLISAIDAMINAAAPASATPLAQSDMQIPEVSNADLGLDDDPELADLTDYLQNALSAVRQFRARRIPPKPDVAASGEA